MSHHRESIMFYFDVWTHIYHFLFFLPFCLLNLFLPFLAFLGSVTSSFWNMRPMSFLVI